MYLPDINKAPPKMIQNAFRLPSNGRIHHLIKISDLGTLYIPLFCSSFSCRIIIINYFSLKKILLFLINPALIRKFYLCNGYVVTFPETLTLDVSKVTVVFFVKIFFFFFIWITLTHKVFSDIMVCPQDTTIRIFIERKFLFQGILISIITCKVKVAKFYSF